MWLRPTEAELAEWRRAAQGYGEYPAEVLRRALLFMILRRIKRFPDPSQISRCRLALAAESVVSMAAENAPSGAATGLFTLA